MLEQEKGPRIIFFCGWGGDHRNLAVLFLRIPILLFKICVHLRNLWINADLTPVPLSSPDFGSPTSDLGS